MLCRLLLVGACAGLVSSPAALRRIEVAERTDVAKGMPFGPAGPYERITGRAYFSVDPKLAANRIIADIDKIEPPVEFSADIEVLKPRDPSKGNQTVLFEIANRGRKLMPAVFNRAASDDETGDGLLFESGYTLVWLGWQWDVPRTGSLLRLYAPSVKGITGPVRAEFTPDARSSTFALGDRDHLSYAVADAGTLTVRDRIDAPRRTIPRDQWTILDGTRVSMQSGFVPGRIYELVYTARDPVLVGLGPAAIRDVISFLKYGGSDNTLLGDQHDYIKRAYGFGISQGGRFLRTFLYYGFNQDEQQRRVFDGVIAHVGGAGRGSFNHRFAQASRDGHPFFNTLYPTDIFPFTDLEQTDPVTGLTDGLLSHAGTPAAAPKIFYTNSSYEYWGRAAALIHTSVDGRQDAPIPETTRIYLFAGGQHGPAGFPPLRHYSQNLPNPNPFTWCLRALLESMQAWVRDGKEPPASQYPRLDRDQLVSVGALNFPKIAGVAVPQRPQRAWRVDYGPQFRTSGIVTLEPPAAGEPFPVLVPQVDIDGNEIPGVRTPEIEVPLATYTGWNLRAAEIGAPTEMVSMVGSCIPFARTKADRLSARDPRPSIAERYAGREEYLKKFSASARDLARRGFLLEQDVPKLIERGAAEWDYFTSTR
jgi:hypothetical protein